MKTHKILTTLVCFLFIYISAVAQTQNSGNKILLASNCIFDDEGYWDNTTTITVSPNIPIKINYTLNTNDYIYIYAYNNGMYTLYSNASSPTSKSCTVISTTGTIFIYCEYGFTGMSNSIIYSLNYDIDPNYSVINSPQYVNGNITTTGLMGIGTTNPQKRLEIFDNNSKFTFSAAVGTYNYVDYRIDGYGYKVSTQGSEKLKILNNNSIGLGKNTMNNTVTGNDNVGIGTNSLSLITSGYQNVAIGLNAMNINTTGSQNVAIGSYALMNVLNSDGNTAIGANSLRYTTSGSHNTATGKASLYLSTTGSYNIATGSGALFNNTVGSSNNAFGFYALLNNVSGSGNTGIGYYSGVYIADGTTSNSTASNSMFIGNNTKALANGQYNQIVIGNNAIGSGNNSVTIGDDNIIKTLLKGKLDIATLNGDGIRIGKINDAGNLNVPLGALSAQYNIDFTGYRDISVDQIGARISALRFNCHITNNAFVQKTGIAFYTNPSGLNKGTLDLKERMRISPEGKVGIGLTDATYTLSMTPVDELLTVNGTIHAKEVKVDLVGLADYVFDTGYKLMPLDQVENYVKENKHLPEIPAASEIKDKGMNMGEMQNKLLQKVEELTLYVIQQQKRIEQLENIIKSTQK